MKNVVEVENLRKVYASGSASVEALKDINLLLGDTQFVAVLGPSGSGKTTLLSCLGGILKPSSGFVKVDGVEIGNLKQKGLSRFRREKVGLIFQSFNLVNSLSALENVEVALRIAGKKKSESSERARDLLEQVGLKNRLHHRPGELSGGEKQRVSIARALANDPKVILADEPTANLDTETAKRIIRLLERLARSKNKAVIVVTHDERMIDHVDTVYRLTDGRIDKEQSVNHYN